MRSKPAFNRQEMIRRAGGSGCLSLLLLLWTSAVPAAEAPASVVQINGSPTLKQGAKSEPLTVGMAVPLDALIVTDDRSKVKIRLADDSVLEIGAKSQLTLREFVLAPENRKARLEVLFGRFRLAITPFLSGGSDYEVRTPTAVAGVRGTVLWGDTDVDAICALEGHVEVQPLHSTVPAAQLATGQCVQQMGKGKALPFTPNPEDLANFLRQVTLD